MNNNVIDKIVKCMATDSKIQRIQTEHRLKLAEFWGIKEGSKVLEIGCGQGDTTAVLGHLVGDTGLVQAIDVASPDYGSPISLGDSIDYLKKSEIGHRINVNLKMDILAPEVNFPEEYFDFVILSHSSWYLISSGELYNIFKKLKKWGKTLCFAEWDTRIYTHQQLPHFLSVFIQAQYECFKKSSISNVRTLFTPMDVKDIAKDAGWEILDETSIYSSDLQDGEWEVKQTLAYYQDELNAIDNMPTKLHTLIKSEIKLLDESIRNSEIRPMSTFCFIAN
jgi:SAM-dependent methyltransferase